MRLWIDGQYLQTGSRLRGIGRYMNELIRALAQTSPDIELSISFNAALSDTAIAARALVSPWIAATNIHVWQGATNIAENKSGYTQARRLGEVALAHHVACLTPDLALSASPFEGQGDGAEPFLTAAGHDIPRAAIFYDAIPYRYPKLYLSHPKNAASYKRRLTAHAGFDLLLAISAFAGREALELFPGVKVAPIDAGVSPDFLALSRLAVDPQALTRLGVSKPFLLYAGATDWRKNLPSVRKAWTLLPPALQRELQFVLVGDVAPSWSSRYRAEWAAAGLPKDKLVGLGHINDADLVQLYKQADLVIQPSLMEGFGLTALEAMSCGAPVIAANTGALPEVVGDTRALFDPEDPAAIAARIVELLSDPDLSRSLVASGLRQASQFSWERTAILAADALRGAARPRTPPSIEATRLITRTALGDFADHDWAAQILAAAEPGTGRNTSGC